MRKRWLKRREFLVYYMLWRSFGEDCFNLGEAIDILRPVAGGKRLAERLVKMLVRHGLLERCRPLEYRAINPLSYLDREAAEYIAGRLRRKGVEAELLDGVLRVRVDSETCNQLRRLAERLGLGVECYSDSSSS